MPTFILGAGFNVDAKAEAGPLSSESLYEGPDRIHCSYPLVGDTLRLCFGQSVTFTGKSIEELFSEAAKQGDYGPIRKLAKRLRYADSRIAQALASGNTLNCYLEFFRAFERSHFLTFNYDCLPETFLFRLGRWYPQDGYGLRVFARLPPGAEAFADKKSSTLVLHLHGSLCVRTSAYQVERNPGQAIGWLTQRGEPRYVFDPSSVSSNFAPFHRDVGIDDVEDRVIAPVPDKTQALNEPFISETYIKADGLARNSDIMVSIGYSFNPHDHTSYQPLLHALGRSTGRMLLVVSPDAGTIVDALRPCFAELSIEPLKATFKEWVEASFPGLDSRG